MVRHISGPKVVGRYNRRKDLNQNDIVDALEHCGCSVTDMSAAGEGFPDLLVTLAGRHFLVEIKSDKGMLTQPQVEFHQKHTPVYIVRSIAEALRVVGLVK